jgi:hypothetical protein
MVVSAGTHTHVTRGRTRPTTGGFPLRKLIPVVGSILAGVLRSVPFVGSILGGLVA